MKDLHIQLNKISDTLWEVPVSGGMRVPARIYADEKLMRAVRQDQSLVQSVNVAHLPGIVHYSLAMPDIHWGYGFPIGGVAATDPGDGGIISPGGVGYDINCGVRLVRTDLKAADVRKDMRSLMTALYNSIPTGVGSTGAIPGLSCKREREILEKGALWAVENGYGEPGDLDHIEDGGRMSAASPEEVSRRAMERGRNQMGTLGSGNHFIELDEVETVYLPDVAGRFGLEPSALAILIHTGSRGLGHQICDDYLHMMVRQMDRYGLRLPDRQLACVPLESPEGKSYFSSMACAANYAWSNRQVITSLVREVLKRFTGLSDRQLGFNLVYDVCHNIAKLEEHEVGGIGKQLCVHRKGATRALPPGHSLLPTAYADVGQPVLIPGDMGTASYVCVGTERATIETLGSTCHGAGRVLSRHAARRKSRGKNIPEELRKQGVIVLAASKRTLFEEIPAAYKDVDRVVEVMQKAGISRKVARLRPIGVLKG